MSVKAASIGRRTAPSDPATHTCEWCKNTAMTAHELTTRKGQRRGLFLYACGGHRPLAHEMTGNTR